MQIIDIQQFIKSHITKRSESLFLDDILQFKDKLRQNIRDKSVLVIGGAGTIGSSFIKAILHYQPKKLYVVDTNENGLTELTRDLRSKEGQFVPNEYLTYPMNFSDDVFKKMFASEGPFDIVANFAAHKHVRSEKDKYSVEAMIDNNVFKAIDLLDLLCEYKPQHFFCVSTDKAANPVNVMGASKKLMEETIMAYSREFKITTARFANVAFSNGSLLDGYVQRLFKGQALSCPRDVKRFFVSPEESGQICMLACILGQSGEIFFPKLEEHEMVNFKDITESFISESGMKPYYATSEHDAKNYTIQRGHNTSYPVFYFESDTSGEKLYEEFYTDQDQIDLDTYASLGVVKNAKRPDKKEILDACDSIKNILNQESYAKEDIVQVMKNLIPDFDHIETGKTLDQKM